jgi:hypothetical protein
MYFSCSVINLEPIVINNSGWCPTVSGQAHSEIGWATFDFALTTFNFQAPVVGSFHVKVVII